MPVDPCLFLFGAARVACEAARNIAAPAVNAASFISDPLGAIAKGCAEAATWTLGKLAEAVTALTQVDFTNPGFVKEYALVFGASTFLTLILWVLAVAKRATRGVPVDQAVGEAIGFLWLAVAAAAFTPLALALLVALTDELTSALAAGTGGDTTRFLTGFGKALGGSVGGGPVMLIGVALLSLAAAVMLYLELLIRAAMLYVGAVLGCAVYSGLVDKSLWRHVRRWAAVMLAIDLSKPVIIIVLGVAAALTAHGSTVDAFSSVTTGLAIMFLSIFVSVVIYRFVPAFGDDMAQLHHTRRQAANAGPAAAVDGPAGVMRQGIASHGSRQLAGASTAGAGAAAPTGGVTAGIAAHGTKKGDMKPPADPGGDRP